MARKMTARTLALAGLFAVLSLAVGCAGPEGFTFKSTCDDRPTGPACQAVTTWQSKVLFAPDSVHGGTPVPGLAGRLYLFGPEISFPLVGDGSLVVDLYDDRPLAEGGKAKLLEVWHIDKDTLKRLLKKDPIGWGYTLFLPWGSYRPEITQVHLMVRYDPAKGSPLFAPSTQLTLEPDAGTETVAARKPAREIHLASEKVVVPANATQAPERWRVGATK